MSRAANSRYRLDLVQPSEVETKTLLVLRNHFDVLIIDTDLRAAIALQRLRRRRKEHVGAAHIRGEHHAITGLEYVQDFAVFPQNMNQRPAEAHHRIVVPHELQLAQPAESLAVDQLCGFQP